jgi:hypothetical protein
VVYGNASFCHHLFQIAVAERIPQIPSNAQNDDLVFEVSPSEKGRPGLSHSLHPSRPASTSLQQIRSRYLRALRCSPGITSG